MRTEIATVIGPDQQVGASFPVLVPMTDAERVAGLIPFPGHAMRFDGVPAVTLERTPHALDVYALTRIPSIMLGREPDLWRVTAWARAERFEPHSIGFGGWILAGHRHDALLELPAAARALLPLRTVLRFK